MTLSWEDYKKAKQKEFGTLVIEISKREPPVKSPEPPAEPPKKLYNVHKRSLPIGNPPLDTIVVFAVSKKEAEWWLEFRLKNKCYENGPDDSKTLIYYDIIPVGATPKERSIFYNESRITTEDVPGFPRRIN